MAAVITVCAVQLWRIIIPPPVSPGEPPPKKEISDIESDPSVPSCDGVPAQTGVLDRIRSRRSIIMGVQENAPPMNYTKEDEKDSEKTTRVGFDYELASLIAANLGLVGPDKVKVKEVELYEQMFCFLKQKEEGQYSVDIIMSGITQDDEKADIDWSEPYYDFGYALIAKKSSNIKGLSDCKSSKTRIGVVKGDSAVMDYVKSKLPKATIVPIEDDDNWINAINLGQVDAIVYDFPFAVSEVKLLNDEKKQNEVTDQYLEIKKPLLEDSESQYCIGIPKGNPDLKKVIDEAIERIKGGTKYVKLINEYFKSEDIRKPDVPIDAKFYSVKRGDSLSRIAQRELDDASRWPELPDLNNIGNEYIIFTNQKLIMPADYKP